MSGLKSRRKGTRAEYLVRDYCRKIGYSAFRVPLSGASEGYKGDVIARKLDTEIVFEVKCRATDFNSIYEMYQMFMAEEKTDVMSVVIGGVMIDISTGFTAMLENTFLYQFPNNFNCLKTKDRSLEKLLKMRELLKGAHILVLKGDRKPLLFVRYK